MKTAATKLLIGAMLLLPLFTGAAIFTVTNTNNTGTGSFRQAILSANSAPGLDTIRFNILDIPGNYFEGLPLQRYAVIRITSALPTITDPVLIDGFSQLNTNLGALPGKVVGADNVTQPNINYPDVYIVADVDGGYQRSTNTSTSSRAFGNGININAINVTIRGIAISGFGNTNSSAATAGLSGDICIMRSPSVRNANTVITDCFIGTDARGNIPSPASRRSIGAAIVIGGFNYNGTIARNYIRHMGTYGIHFNGTVDHASVGPSSANLPNRNWLIEDNQLIDISWNHPFGGPGNFVTSTTGLVSDAINTMNSKRFIIRRNYIEDVEQVGIDLGWNADSNYVENNSITGFTKTHAGPVQCGIRAALSSRGDSLVKNRIYDNNGTAFMAGIWIDQSSAPGGNGISVYDNNRHFIAQNVIHNNASSGIVISTYTPASPAVNAREITITRNSIYRNNGLGIDLGFNGITGPVSVTPNDNGDVDVGVNNLQNFPIIDSVKVNPAGTFLNVFGKAPPGATLEFFYSDGDFNNHGGFTLNYGEGQTFIGSGVEGSAADLATGSGSYNIDGNISINNDHLFRFVFPISGPPAPGVRLTATATLNGSTSEFSPYDVSGFIVLSTCDVLEFTGTSRSGANYLHWKAECGRSFSHFELEYSTDNRHFYKLTQISGSEGLVERNFLHTDLPSSLIYYRLKLVDQNGTSRYSNTIQVRNEHTIESMRLGPVPFTGNLTVQLRATVRSTVEVQLVDFMGRTVFVKSQRVERGSNVIRLEQLERFASGNYLVRVVDAFTGSSSVMQVQKQ